MAQHARLTQRAIRDFVGYVRDVATSDLRTVRHEQTRQALLDAAVELFEQHGYGAVTMEQIAATVGVSRRTAYRRFPTKDDILLELPRRWLRVWDGFIADHDGRSAGAAVRDASVAVAAHIDAHRHQTIAGLNALAGAPGLNAATVAHDDWHRRVVDLLTAEGVDTLDAQVIAGAHLGAIDAALAWWAADPDEEPLVPLVEGLNDRLRPVWPD